jgi:predicted nucleic acid-binding protein
VAALEGKFVVDTNVILKLFFPEEDADKAVLLFQCLESGAIHVFVPDLLPIEFINILWVKRRQGQADSADCQTILRKFLDLLGKLTIVASVAFAEEILDASIRHDHPACDMTFLVLADSLRIPLITADAGLCRKLSSFSRPPILLRDLRAKS